MAFEEIRAWLLGVVTVVSYAVYAAIVLGRAGGGPLAEVRYVPTLLWSIIGSIVASIVLSIVVSMFVPGGPGRKDRRDREIYRYGEYAGNSLIIAGGIAALGLAMLEAPYFWIANAVYLAFVLATLLSSAMKILGYRRGFQW